MKKLISILAVAFVTLNFVSCREDDSADIVASSSPTETTLKNSRIQDTVKSDTLKAAHKVTPVDPDPPVKDGTSW